MDIIAEVYCDGDEVFVLDGGNVLSGVIRSWVIQPFVDDNGNNDYELLYDVDVMVFGDKMSVQVPPSDIFDKCEMQVDTLVDILNRE